MGRIRDFKGYVHLYENHKKFNLDETTYEKATQRVKRCVSKILMKGGFFGNILAEIPIAISKQCKISATDGSVFIFNPEGVQTLSDDELIWVIDQGLLHLALGHYDRKDGKELGIWNKAADIASEPYLNGHGKSMIEDYPPEYENKTAEEIYADLKRKGEGKDFVSPCEVLEPGDIKFGEVTETLIGELDQLRKPSDKKSTKKPSDKKPSDKEKSDKEEKEKKDLEKKDKKDLEKKEKEEGEKEKSDEEPDSKQDADEDDEADSQSESDEEGDSESEGDGDESSKSSESSEKGEEGEQGEESDNTDPNNSGEEWGEDNDGESQDKTDWDGRSERPEGQETSTEINTDAIKDKIKEITQRASTRSLGGGGGMSPALRSFMDKVANPQINWRKILQRYVSEASEDATVYKIPNRRFISSDMYLPGLRGKEEGFGTVVIGVDTSGSIGQDEYTLFLSEVRHILKSFAPEEIYIIYCSDQIDGIDHLKNASQKLDRNKMRSTGGNACGFDPPFKWAEENILKKGKTLACMLYFTDGGAYDPIKPKWHKKVIWTMTTAARVMPFGRHIVIPQN